MAESWFALSAEDQKEALAVAAGESGWPAFLLEKDIWVVWALQILGRDQQLLPSLTFKGGTSLSKAHGLIDRFLEDVDLMGGAVACLRFALDFALFGPAGPASDTLNDKKDPLRRKEPNKMEPSGFEPLTPCMPCRERPDRTSLAETARIQ